MRIFTINTNNKLIPYEEYQFKDSNVESELESLLESNPDYFFEDSKILIIGRQVTTNLNTFIDLLGIDKNGNTVAVELKREKTPRETIAQLLEYASFVENLDYAQLNEIYQNYTGEDVDLESFHKEYFNAESDEALSFNKSTKLVIVAQIITKEINQTALYLRKKGIDIYCVEFKYFKTKSGEKIISSNFVIGEDEFIRSQVQSASLPKVNEKQFIDSLDENGFRVFSKIFEFANKNNLLFRWGSKGFSLNVEFDNSFTAIIFGYPPASVFRQSIYTAFDSIQKKVVDSGELIDLFKTLLLDFGHFEPAKNRLKWVIEENYSQEKIDEFINILYQIVEKIKSKELKA